MLIQHCLPDANVPVLPVVGSVIIGPARDSGLPRAKDSGRSAAVLCLSPSRDAMLPKRHQYVHALTCRYRLDEAL